MSNCLDYFLNFLLDVANHLLVQHIACFQTSEMVIIFNQVRIRNHSLKSSVRMTMKQQTKRFQTQNYLNNYDSSHHLFSSRTLASSSGVKSFTILNVLRMSSGVLPLIMDATLAQVRSRSDLMSMYLAARLSSNNISCSTSTNAASQAGTTSFILLLLRGLSMSGIFSTEWCLQNSITLASTSVLTFGRGISWSSSSDEPVLPPSSSSPPIIILTSSDIMATFPSISNLSPLWLTRVTFAGGDTSAFSAEAPAPVLAGAAAVAAAAGAALESDILLVSSPKN